MHASLTYPRVRIQYRESSGQIWKVLVEDENGTVVDLPVRGVDSTHEANQRGEFNIRIGAYRVRHEYLSEEECGYKSV